MKVELASYYVGVTINFNIAITVVVFILSKKLRLRSRSRSRACRVAMFALYVVYKLSKLTMYYLTLQPALATVDSTLS